MLELLGDGSSPRALVLTGEPGIGKTTLWETVLAAASNRGLRVLAARAGEAEARLSFVGLADLLDDVASDELAALPSPQRRALEIALLRAEPTGTPPGEQAIALGILNALRSLAARAPLSSRSTTLRGWTAPPPMRSPSPRAASAASRSPSSSPGASEARRPSKGRFTRSRVSSSPG